MNTLSATLEPESSAVNAKPLADSRCPLEKPFSPTWIAPRAKRTRIHINLLDGHWSMQAGHWSVDLALGSASMTASPAQPRVAYVDATRVDYRIPATATSELATEKFG